MSSPGKKRYQVTLTEETVKEFLQLAEELRMPQGTMSSILDDALLNVTQTIQKLKGKGRVTFGDLFSIVGEQMALMEEKEVHQDDKKATEVGKTKESARKKA